MRYNKQELLTLATQPSQKFDKEGVLLLRERQEGFFRRTESEYFSLRMNLCVWRITYLVHNQLSAAIVTILMFISIDYTFVRLIRLVLLLLFVNPFMTYSYITYWLSINCLTSNNPISQFCTSINIASKSFHILC